MTNEQTSTGIKTNISREVTPIYWWKLIEAGVPINTANILAWAIAR